METSDKETQAKMDAIRLLFGMVFNNNDNEISEDDNTFRQKTTEQITNRDEKYSELLSHFVDITKVRNRLKEFFKWTFYLTIIIAMVVLIRIVYNIFSLYTSSADIDKTLESMPLLITAMVGFVSTIITIPVAITKYLFSTKEDENITQIILHTQDHDVSGRQWAMDFKKILKSMEDNVGMTTGNLPNNVSS